MTLDRGATVHRSWDGGLVCRRSIIDAYLAIVSVRVVREYADTPIEDDRLQRILQAGRATGSSQNRQPWKFYVVRSRDALGRLAPSVFAPGNIENCQVAIAVMSTSKSAFDGARCAQNMILAAWSMGIGSSPNSPREVDAARVALGVAEDETIVTILSFGYPLRPWTPREDDVEGILQRVRRKPLEDLVVWVS